MSDQRRQDLRTTDAELRQSDTDFGPLFSMLPHQLFISRNGHVLLNPQYLPSCRTADSLRFAFHDKERTLRFDARFSQKAKDIWNMPLGSGARISMEPPDDHLVIFDNIPPMAWITNQPATWRGGVYWGRKMIALIQYFLITHATDQGCTVGFPRPDREDLEGILRILKLTRHYKQAQAMLENCQDLCEDMSGPHHDGMLTPESIATADPPSSGLENDTVASKSAVQYQARNIPLDAIEDKSLKNSPLQDKNDDPTTSEITGSTTHFVDKFTASFKSGSIQLPKPDCKNEDRTSGYTDDILRLLQREDKVGSKLLSRLPALDVLTFAKIHRHKHPGQLLPLRLRIASSSGRVEWVSFKFHATNIAPRMLLHAYSSADELIEQDLNFKRAFPSLHLEPAFNAIKTRGAKGENQFKALVKYYFILAANARIHGFTKHHIPENVNFVDNLRSICLQVRPQDMVDVDSVGQQPLERPRRTRFSIHFVGTENGTQSALSDPLLHPTGSLPSEHLNQRPMKRKLALPKISNGWEQVTVNGFIDPDADVLTSDGESGDEIPPAIPKSVQAVLHVGEAIRWNRNRIKNLKASKASKKLEQVGEVKNLQQEIDKRQKGIKGFEAMEEGMKEKLGAVFGKYEKTWKILQKQQETFESQQIQQEQIRLDQSQKLREKRLLQQQFERQEWRKQIQEVVFNSDMLA